jgi:hypothetical protein
LDFLERVARTGDTIFVKLVRLARQSPTATRKSQISETFDRATLGPLPGFLPAFFSAFLPAFVSIFLSLFDSLSFFGIFFRPHA